MRDSNWFFGGDQRGRASRGIQIVCTIGPACRDEATLYKLILAGMTVVRLHSAYADHAEHLENIERIRRASARAGVHVAILQDLAGAKMRIARIHGDQVQLRTGNDFVLRPSSKRLGAQMAVVPVPELFEVVEPGDLILLADGAIRLRATNLRGGTIHCRVEQGGLLKTHQAVHVPDRTIHVEVPTRQDAQDLEFGLQHGVDWVAQSFVEDAGDVQALRHWMNKHHGDLPIIAKIERPAAVRNLTEVVLASDGVMAARGDLGMHFPLETVAMLQKEIIRCCNVLRKPVITATEMLFSMVDHPQPTRAEVADVTNAVLDGTSGIMLSGETGIGRYPVEATQMASRIVRCTRDYSRLQPALDGIGKFAEGWQ